MCWPQQREQGSFAGGIQLCEKLQLGSQKRAMCLCQETYQGGGWGTEWKSRIASHNSERTIFKTSHRNSGFTKGCEAAEQNYPGQYCQSQYCANVPSYLSLIFSSIWHLLPSAQQACPMQLCLCTGISYFIFHLQQDKVYISFSLLGFSVSPLALEAPSRRAMMSPRC